MPDQTLYLSSDKKFLTDKRRCNIYSLISDNDSSYYRIIGLESEAFEKVCTKIIPVKVCTSSSSAGVCKQWEEVDICIGWQLVQKGTTTES